MIGKPGKKTRKAMAVFVYDPEEKDWDFWGFDSKPETHETTKRYCAEKGLRIHVVETKLPIISSEDEIFDDEGREEQGYARTAEPS